LVSIICTLDVDHIIVAVAFPPFRSTFRPTFRPLTGTFDFSYDTFIVVFGFLRFRGRRRRWCLGFDEGPDRFGFFGNLALFNDVVRWLLSSDDNLLSRCFLLNNDRLRRGLTYDDRLWLWLGLGAVLGGLGILLEVVRSARSPYADISFSLHAPLLVFG